MDNETIWIIKIMRYLSIKQSQRNHVISTSIGYGMDHTKIHREPSPYIEKEI